jgi:hypothetical protein
MPSARSMVVAGVAAAAIALPGVAIAQSAGDLAAGRASVQAAKRHNTWIVFQFDHTRGFGTHTIVRGQIAWKTGTGQVASVPGGKRVALRRSIAGGPWHRLGHERTGDKGRFAFKARSKANARYRVVFKGNQQFQPTVGVTSVSVYRHFDAKLEDVSGRFHGRVTPGYAHERIFLEKRPCADCGWHRARSRITGDRGRFHFTVGAPTHGRFWWRVRTPADKRFIQSYSSVFTTERH